MKLDNYEKYEKIRKSIHMVAMHGMFTESELQRAWKKFYKKIQNDVYDNIKIESM